MCGSKFLTSLVLFLAGEEFGTCWGHDLKMHKESLQPLPCSPSKFLPFLLTQDQRPAPGPPMPAVGE